MCGERGRRAGLPLCRTIAAVISQTLPPGAATNRALALAWLTMRFAAPEGDVERDIHLLPAYIEAEQRRGTHEDLPTLVRRFMQGARTLPQHGTPVPRCGLGCWIQERRTRGPDY